MILNELVHNYDFSPSTTQDKPVRALMVFAHGAGADSHSDFMNNFTLLLNDIGCDVVRFNFPYMVKRQHDGKRRPPDRMPVLLACYEQVLTQLSVNIPIFLIGKSMGGRVASTLVSDKNIDVSGVICLGYPFHPHKKPESLRLLPLQNTVKPVLIIQGERDSLGSEGEIKQYDIADLCQIMYLPDGDHHLKPRVKSGYTHQQHLSTAIDQISRFIDEVS